MQHTQNKAMRALIIYTERNTTPHNFYKLRIEREGQRREGVAGFHKSSERLMQIAGVYLPTHPHKVTDAIVKAAAAKGVQLDWATMDTD